MARVRNVDFEIREAGPTDWAEIWPFLRQIVSAGETYVYDRDLTESAARRLWMLDPPGRTVSAVRPDGVVVGTAKMHANHGGPGSHVATASFMVNPAFGGKGVGRALGEHVLTWARSAGYLAMQFNAVVETNAGAVALWRSLGFELVATVPAAFHHPTRGYVGLHVMHRYV